MMILNRDNSTGKYVLPADGWYHLARFGDFPGEQEMSDGTTREIIQRITPLGVDSMISIFNRQKEDPTFTGAILDYDHFSHDLEKSSEAAGWIMDLQKRETGLWGKIDLTPNGEADLVSGKFKKLSSVWDGPEVAPGIIEPRLFIDAGLTNKPKLSGLVPLTNRIKNRAGRHSANSDNMNYTPATIAALVAALGLPADATEAQVTTALPEAVTIMNRGRNEYPTLKENYDRLLDSVANSDLDEFGIKDEAERAQVKPMLIANREGTRALLGRGKPAEQKTHGAPIHNRASAAVPKPIESESAEAAREKAAAGVIKNRANELKAATPSRRWSDCQAQAEAEYKAKA